MTRLFLSYAQQDSTSADKIRTGLEAQGYTTWRDPDYPDPTSASYPHLIESAILGSAAVILVWSQHAAQATWVEQYLLIAQRLQKPIFPVMLDNTSLPNTLVAIAPPLTVQTDCTTTVDALIALPSFPPVHSTDALITVSELAAHEYIRERKSAIDQAAALLARGEHRAEMLALLDSLAHNDLMMGVREKAQEVLDAKAQNVTPAPPPFHPKDAQYIFGVRCKNEHISYFDKRLVCVAHTFVSRSMTQTGKELDELHLTCETCGEAIVAHVDCEGYR